MPKGITTEYRTPLNSFPWCATNEGMTVAGSNIEISQEQICVRTAARRRKGQGGHRM